MRTDGRTFVHTDRRGTKNDKNNDQNSTEILPGSIIAGLFDSIKCHIPFTLTLQQTKKKLRKVTFSVSF